LAKKNLKISADLHSVHVADVLKATQGRLGLSKGVDELPGFFQSPCKVYQCFLVNNAVATLRVKGTVKKEKKKHSVESQNTAPFQTLTVFSSSFKCISGVQVQSENCFCFVKCLMIHRAGTWR